MREIKFRFVCKDLSNKIFFLYYSLDDFINGFSLGNIGRIEEIISKDQYTGLKDINNIEIYGGDICEVPLDYGPGGIHVQIVKINLTKYDGWQLKKWMFNIGIEIIGNIHENHKLLES